MHNLQLLESIDSSSPLAIDFIHNLDHPVIDLYLLLKFHEIVAHYFQCNCMLIYCY